MITPKELVAEAKTMIREVDVPTAVQLIAQGVVIIDIREEFEYAAGHLPDSIHIPRGVLEFKTPDEPVFKDPHAQILLYCRSGGRSALAALSLQRMGYDNVLSMAGGFEAWKAHHEPVDQDRTNFGG